MSTTFFRRGSAALAGLALMGASWASSALILTFNDEAAFLAALGGSATATMDYEGVAQPVPPNPSSSDIVSVPGFSQSGISLSDLSHIIHETFNDSSATAGRYNIGADATDNSVGHNNPTASTGSRTATVTHSSGSFFASGMTLFTVRDNATHAGTTVRFHVGGESFDVLTDDDDLGDANFPTGNLTTAGTTQFFGFISDVALSSYQVETFAAQSDSQSPSFRRRFLITDNLHVHTAQVNVPGPASAALLLVGFAGLVVSKRRRV